MLSEPKTGVAKPNARPATMLLLLSAALLGIGVFTPEKLPFLTDVGILTGLGSSFWLIFQRFRNSDSANLQHQTWFRNLTKRGIAAWLLGVALTGFYVVLYWFPQKLEFLIRKFDGLSQLLQNKNADQWFLYGALYTLAIMIMGTRALLKYRHSKYHLLRTSANIFFQLVFAFLLPHILVLFNQPEFYFSYFWPLKFEYLFPDTIHNLLAQSGGLPVFMVFWSVLLSFVATPVLTYFWGKRWYCSWVCGCGALAETAGDPFRHLSDKSRNAWRLEVATVYTVLAFVIMTTALLWLNSYLQGGLLGSLSGGFARSYGFFIGIIFSGVIGVGFYPIFGSRVWCRFGCPMAVYLGLLQKHFSRFRITTNGGQCISCGNCSTYCEMGIDVKQYAQQGKPIIRAACVGCGMCATVCPRGVLKLENKKPENRYTPTPFFHAENLRILE